MKNPSPKPVEKKIVFTLKQLRAKAPDKKKAKVTTAREIDIPEGIQATRDGRFLVVKGPKGELKREFFHRQINVEIKDKKILISTEEKKRKTKAVLGSWSSHMANMMAGVKKGWKCEMKLVFSHFPAKMSFKDREFTVQNFLGERAPRVTRLPADVNVKVDKENVTLTGVDKEIVGAASGKIERVTKIVGYDRRIFQDGCYITKKTHLQE